jgi:hypothetical protein
MRRNTNVTDSKAFTPPDLQFLLDLLFETYPIYQDRESRRAVESILNALANSQHATTTLAAIIDFLKQESLRKNIAPADAFVLVDWSSVLLQQFAKLPEQWSKWGSDLAVADAKLLETCMAAGDSPKASRIQRSALVVTRRALRSLFTSEEVGKDAFSKLLATFTAKSASPTAGNAVILGVIAGVSSRLAAVKPMLGQHKQDYYTFYVREIIGSRTQLPRYICNGLHDFFDTFPTVEELQKDIIPPIEKALLRAPEVVLNDIISPMILALPKSMDMSSILHGNLLKPLLSNVKSTNATIRAGALRVFQALASRSLDETLLGKIADEVLNPLKQGKVTSAEQKVLHAQMLASLPNSVSLAQRIPSALAPVALKEPNEQAVVAEVSAIIRYLTFGLHNAVSLEKSIIDVFSKGMADKRIPVRRLWAIRAAEVWWHLSPGQYSQPDIQAFCQSTLPTLVGMWQEVIANPVPATQTGMVTVAHFVTAILLTKANSVDDEKLAAIYKKADAASQVLALQPKPSLLLNPRVYTKLSSVEDIEIALHAYTAVVPWLSKETTPQAAREAWSQALIYFIVAQSSPPKAKTAAKEALTQAYLQAPASISEIVIQGLWAWYKSAEEGDKDSAAVAAKSGTSELSSVLHSFCLSPDQIKKSGATIPEEQLQQQCVHLLIIARPEIIPRASWIDICLRVGADPGQLARDYLDECITLANDSVMVRCSTEDVSSADYYTECRKLQVPCYQQSCVQRFC